MCILFLLTKLKGNSFSFSSPSSMGISTFNSSNSILERVSTQTSLITTDVRTGYDWVHTEGTTKGPLRVLLRTPTCPCTKSRDFFYA